MFIFGACLALLVGITAVMVGFIIRYHRSRSPEPTSKNDGNLWLEIIWTVFPTILVMAMFYYGWDGYLALRNVPKGAMEVTATARMWSWTFTYPNGKTSSKLYVPAGKPVKVDLVALDVLHGFYLPAFRVKRDAVPGMKNHAWFVATKPGSYDLFCSQYCGTGHSAMITTVEALPEAEFTAWLTSKEQKAAEHPGKALLEKHGCLGCHSLDGSPKVGPTFKGLYHSTIKVLVEGKPVTVTVDDAYLTESIVKPSAKIVEGFPPIMPMYPDLTAEDVKALVEFIEEIK
jgi:cytochrome c oxidase subunit 2